MRQRVRRFQRRNDALGAGAELERLQRLLVGRGDVFDAADIVQPGMLRPDAGIVQAGADAVRLLDLAVVVLQQIGAVAVQHAGAAARSGWRRARPCRARARRPRRRSAAPSGRRGTGGTGPSRWSRRRSRRPRRRAAGPRLPASARLASSPITHWKSRTIIGYGCGPATVPIR